MSNVQPGDFARFVGGSNKGRVVFVERAAQVSYPGVWWLCAALQPADAFCKERRRPVRLSIRPGQYGVAHDGDLQRIEPPALEEAEPRAVGEVA